MVTGFGLDIYDCDFVFAWDTNEAELNEILDRAETPADLRKEFFDTIGERDMQAVTVAMGTKLIAIVFKCEPTKKVVAHEIFHAAYRCLHPRGIKDEEAYAYAVGYITEMFYDLYEGKYEETE